MAAAAAAMKPVQSALGKPRRFDPLSKALIDCVLEKHKEIPLWPREIEFRLGRLQSGGKRHMLRGMMTSAPLADDHGQTFVPGITEHDFLSLAEVLRCHPCHETKTTDVIYTGGIRDCQETGTCIHKTRLKNLDFTNPTGEYDFRLSVSTEEKCTAPSKTTPILRIRKKHRFSFDVSGLGRVDLTIVTSGATVTHEVEVELTQLKHAMDECRANRYHLLRDNLLLAVQTVEEFADILKKKKPLKVEQKDLKGQEKDLKSERAAAHAAFDAALKQLHATRDPNDPMWQAWGGLPSELLCDT